VTLRFTGGRHFPASNADDFDDFVNQEVREMKEEMVRDACDNLAFLIGAYEALSVVSMRSDVSADHVSELLTVLNERFRVSLDILGTAGVLS
jgi:hypothetical protein